MPETSLKPHLCWHLFHVVLFQGVGCMRYIAEQISRPLLPELDRPENSGPGTPVSENVVQRAFCQTSTDPVRACDISPFPWFWECRTSGVICWWLKVPFSVAESAWLSIRKARCARRQVPVVQATNACFRKGTAVRT